jgi:hypothetical protein
MAKKKTNDPDGIKINPDGSKSFRVKGQSIVDGYEKHWGVTVRRVNGELSATDKIFKDNMNKPRPIKGGSAFSDFYGRNNKGTSAPGTRGGGGTKGDTEPGRRPRGGGGGITMNLGKKGK